MWCRRKSRVRGGLIDGFQQKIPRGAKYYIYSNMDFLNGPTVQLEKFRWPMGGGEMGEAGRRNKPKPLISGGKVHIFARLRGSFLADSFRARWRAGQCQPG